MACMLTPRAPAFHENPSVKILHENLEIVVAWRPPRRLRLELMEGILRPACPDLPFRLPFVHPACRRATRASRCVPSRGPCAPPCTCLRPHPSSAPSIPNTCLQPMPQTKGMAPLAMLLHQETPAAAKERSPSQSQRPHSSKHQELQPPPPQPHLRWQRQGRDGHGQRVRVPGHGPPQGGPPLPPQRRSGCPKRWAWRAVRAAARRAFIKGTAYTWSPAQSASRWAHSFTSWLAACGL